jgi:hypothetical protein
MLSWKRPLGSHRHHRNWLPLSDLIDCSFREARRKQIFKLHDDCLPFGLLDYLPILPSYLQRVGEPYPAVWPSRLLPHKWHGVH